MTLLSCGGAPDWWESARFLRLFWAWAGSGKVALSRPIHQRVTLAVSLLRQVGPSSKIIMKPSNLRLSRPIYLFLIVILTELILVIGALLILLPTGFLDELPLGIFGLLLLFKTI